MSGMKNEVLQCAYNLLGANLIDLNSKTLLHHIDTIHSSLVTCIIISLIRASRKSLPVTECCSGSIESTVVIFNQDRRIYWRFGKCEWILFFKRIFAYLRIKDFSKLRLKFFLEIITSFWYNFCCFLPTNYGNNSHTYLFNNSQQFLNNI